MKHCVPDDGINSFKELVEQEFGLTLGTHSKETIMRKVMPRIHALKLGSLSDYVDYLMGHPMARTELYNLPTLIMNTESYFLREFVQFELLIELIIKKKRLKNYSGDRTIKVLSAGCSEGQEPFSISMLLRNIKDQINVRDIRIYGLDINIEALGKAQAGIYSSYSFRNSNRELIRKYFEETGKDHFFSFPDRFRLRSDVLNSVEFSHANMLQPVTFRGINDLDFIFCRNVLMYMSQKAVGRIAFNLWEALREDGYLFIGQSESLRNHHDLFEPVSYTDTVVYKKRRG